MEQLGFLPYGRQTIEQDDVDAVVQVLRSDFLTTGPTIARFERALAAHVGARDAVALANGTAALHAACFAAGVSEGDEVIVPAVTFVATANCARFLGAEPVFADVDPRTGLMRAEEVERCRSTRTRAVIPVHLTGAPAPVAAIRQAAGPGVKLIEDAAHALGAVVDGSPVGGCGADSEMSIFSFHPVKHITTGEGGAVTVNDEALLQRLRQFRDHGIVRDPSRWQHSSPGPWYYEQQSLGHNLRLTDIQAALGVSQLHKLERFVARRRVLAARYDELLRDHPAVSPVTDAAQRRDSSYHLYCVRIAFADLGIERSAVMNRLRERGIGTQVHYIPVPQQPFYTARGWRGEDFPGAQQYAAQTLSLPMFPAMQDEDVDRVVDSLAEALHELRAH